MATEPLTDRTRDWGTCDWGDCDEPTIALRVDREGCGWLPVCRLHVAEDDAARRASDAQVRLNDSHEPSGFTVAAEIAARGPLTLAELDRHFEAAADDDDGRATVSLDRADFNRLRAAARAALAAARAPQPAPPECTGWTARWCPIHGDCTCRRFVQGDGNSDQGFDDPRCPLHGDTSAHDPRPAPQPAPDEGPRAHYTEGLSSDGLIHRRALEGNELDLEGPGIVVDHWTPAPQPAPSLDVELLERLVTLVRFGFLVMIGGERATVEDVHNDRYSAVLLTILGAKDVDEAVARLAERAPENQP